MKIQIISRETLKPSSPTPQSLRDFKLSFIDQLIPSVYVSMLSFYSSTNGSTNNHFERSEKLKKSFSDMLTLFYPLAGKTVDNITIDCSDYGALFVEARVDCTMSEFLQQTNWDQLGEFTPIKLESTEETVGFFSVVQVSFFDCGGVAISMTISHKLADAATAAVAMRCWAVTTIGSTDAAEAVVPMYNSAEIFPPRRFSAAGVPPLVDFKKEKFPIRRLVFEASKVAALKALAVSESVERPTRAESVTALIWKCALNAARSNSGVSRPSMLTRAVNIRRKIEPPLPDNSVGNLIGFYIAEKDESKMELNSLVHEIRDKLKVFDKNYVKMLQQEDAFETMMEYLKMTATQMMKRDMEFYVCTTWCNFSFYDIDFGWGRPVWVTMGSGNAKNVIQLMDTNKGDGSIEAWVALSEQDMYLFERDPELLAYASLNPSVLDT
ncbi:hypothetical protein Dsin_010577 [Dipteronia sinensis]|uniref:BAHD acyltransferase n=1 Tax=Dipteronia sinensis TaxID=43782 RepID=A0AAE0ED64_9ROSI|nr:hypothetical protein Dsin_010577 [Dipteronia sinensis]